MNEKELLEYNKRCAEFLNLHRDEEVVIYNMHSYCYDLLKFDSDWNWIMDVVEAIEKNCAWVKIRGQAVDISTIANTVAPTKKEAVVQAINQFLIWYEQNK
jgi:hypothetical protein